MARPVQLGRTGPQGRDENGQAVDPDLRVLQATGGAVYVRSGQPERRSPAALPDRPAGPDSCPPALSPRPWRNRRASSRCTPGWNGKRILSCRAEINRVFQPGPPDSATMGRAPLSSSAMLEKYTDWVASRR